MEFCGQEKPPWSHMFSIIKRQLYSQAGRRRFDPGLPAHFQQLSDTRKSCTPVWPKYSSAMRRCTATMLIRYAEQHLRTVAGVRDGLGEPAPSPSIRIPDRGESNSSLPCLWTSAALGRRALYA